ncbi:single-stranded DNA-binding protein [Microseira wollei]|uniref:Single-strand binding protein n=2 Tax=Microseira TaxID=1609595 RepID=A0AAV3X3E0_9CYAN|nr:single-stranded DNA-binding protein [Microseira wollei]GET36528.1 single-strand binding protein [Microseira wollei NIES-4236]
MNSCILMAEIVDEPQLRYTPDNQVPVAEMVVEFPGLRSEEPPSTLKVVGWGNLAQEIKERCHPGDRVVLEGRLSMNTIERKPEGFKEKRAELTVQKVHYLEADRNFIPAEPASTPAKTTPAYSSPDYSSRSATATASPPKVATVPQVHDDEPIPPVTTPQFPSQPMPVSEPDVDEIPF